MQQRQLRLGDVLDDYCPRERRLTNHVIVAMVGDDVKQTRCTTCDADHEYKQAKVPRPRRKSEPVALAPHAVPVAPKKVVHEARPESADEPVPAPAAASAEPIAVAVAAVVPGPDDVSLPDEDRLLEDGEAEAPEKEEGPVHRPLIRAQLPRTEGQPPAPRQAPDFTIRQPAGRQNRFRPRHPRAGGGSGGGQGFQANRSDGNMNGNTRGGPPRQHGGRPPVGPPRFAKRHGPQGPGGRKRSK